VVTRRASGTVGADYRERVAVISCAGRPVTIPSVSRLTQAAPPPVPSAARSRILSTWWLWAK